MTTLRVALVASVAALSVLCPARGQAQSSASSSRPESRANQESLNQAVAAMLDPKGFHMTGDATTRTPDNVGSGGFGSGGAFRVTSAAAMSGDFVSMGGGSPFTGSFEILRTAKAELLVSSKLALPGFALLKIGERVLTSRTYETDGPDPSSLRRELLPLLDPAVLVPAVRAATATLGRDLATGGDLWRLTLPTELINPKPANGAKTLRSFGGIKRLDAIFVVDRNGSATGCQFIVTRDDPMAGFRHAIATDGGGAAGSTIVVTSLGDIAGDAPTDGADVDKDGPATTYTLKVTGNAPSPRAERTIEHLRDLLPTAK